MTLSEELKWRGFVNQTTFKKITELDEQKRTFYWGVDPSATSMTIGHLAAAMMVKIFIKHGYAPILLVGGATGLIGDPDGKAQERDLKSTDEIAKNKHAIAEQYKRLFDGQEFKLVDNYEWFKNINYLEFLRDIGKHVPMRMMLGREFVQARLKENGSGISYAEFSYSLIQGYDFLHLHEKHGVTLQLAGADQWGNSIAGVDLIRRKTGHETHVWTFPLIINKETGVKFGKSEAGAIWLDASLTTPYQFYQFWLNTDDDNVIDYLKIFTQIDKDEFDTLIHDFNADRSKRDAQKRLAYDVTTQVHGREIADSIVRISEALFNSHDYSHLKEFDLNELVHELPFVEIKLGDEFVDVLVETSLAKSKTEARRFIHQGAVYVNGGQVDENTRLDESHMLANKFTIIRRGKNAHAILRVVS